MGKQSLGIKVLIWTEVVVALRILLFIIPTMVNKFLVHRIGFEVSDWFLFLLSMVSLFYLIVGVASLLGTPLWQIFHYVVTLVICCLTGIGLWKLSSLSLPVNFYNYIPAICSIVISLFIFSCKDKTV